MKSLQLSPTETNLIRTYEMDSIKRNEDIHSFVDILKENYNRFMSGEYSEILKDVLDFTGGGENYYYNKLLEYNESYSDEEGKTKVTVEDKVTTLCHKIFQSPESSNTVIRVGDLNFGGTAKNYLLSITNILKNNPDNQ